jgi:hypothetical protein
VKASYPSLQCLVSSLLRTQRKWSSDAEEGQQKYGTENETKYPEILATHVSAAKIGGGTSAADVAGYGIFHTSGNMADDWYRSASTDGYGWGLSFLRL